MYVRSEVWHFPHLLSYHFRSLPELELIHVRQLAGQQVTFLLINHLVTNDLHHGTLISLVQRHMLKGLPLYMGAGNLNLGLHNCSFTNEAISQSNF